MSQSGSESLIQVRVSQLQAISARRNELLRQLYHLICRRQRTRSVFVVDDEDDEDLHTFLRKHDLNNNYDSASIENLDESQLFPLKSLHDALAPHTPSHVSDDNQVPSGDMDINMTDVNRQIEPRAPGIVSSRHEDEDSDNEVDLLVSHNIAQDSSQSLTMPVAPELTSLVSLPSKIKKNDEPEPSTVILKQDSTTTDLSPTEVTMEASHLSKVDSQPEVVKDMDGSLDAAMNVDQPITTTTVSPMQLQLTPEPIAVPERTATPQVPMQPPPRSITPLHPQSSSEHSAERSHIPVEDQPEALSATKHMVSSHTSEPFPSFETPAHVHLRRPVTIPIPASSVMSGEQFQFGLPAVQEPPKLPVSPVLHHHQFNRNYSLPPLKSLPPEFNRKGKLIKLQRKREKEREKKKDGGKEEWAPMGLNRWAATINANPVWKKVSRASKCLTTREWAVAMTELRLVRTLDRVELLKDAGRWSFRQPKKQRGVGGLAKTHWDYLMDEMKWMRTDFREERKWKLALAYNLSTAVLEWHALKSWEERAAHGICVKWKSSYNREEEETQPMDDHPVDPMDIDQTETQDSEPRAQSSLLGIDYGSDEGDDDDKQSVVDALEPSTIIQDALNDTENQDEEGPDDTDVPLQPKREDIDDTTALQAGPSQSSGVVGGGEDEGQSSKPLGLKSTSDDPLLTSKSTPQSINGDTEFPVPPPKSSKVDTFAPLREKIVYSGTDQLFIDANDLVKRTEDLSLEPNVSPPDLSEIFPDLLPFALIDTPGAPTETKKKSGKRDDKDDLNKRVEETTYTKLYPAGRFMFSKPTLLGSLQPSKRWIDGKWLHIDENPVSSDPDSMSKISEDSQNDLFDNRTTNAQAALLSMHMHAAYFKDKDSKKKGVEHFWSEQDDALLKSLIDRYLGNWALISECFNGARQSTMTDRRTPRDCLDRWREKWAPDARQRAVEPAPTHTQDDNAASGPSSMTTRGVKRLASTTVSSPNASGVASQGEPKKRRRHLLLQETIRKAVKKKAEHAQKTAASQRKPAAVHETHNQYSKLPKLSAAELSRMKTEKDAREQQEVLLARRRQEELNRQMQAQRMGHAVQPASQQLQGQIQTQAQGQAQPQTQPQVQVQVPGQPVVQQALAQPASQVTAQPNGSPSQRPGGVSMTVPQIRSQVNISRMSTPTLGNTGAPRLTPQQLLQMHQAQAQARASSAVGGQIPQAQAVLAQVQAQGQGQGQGQVGIGAGTVNGVVGGTHASPPRNNGTQGNVVNSPRSGLDQLQTGGVPVTANGVGRPVSSAGNQYYLNMLTSEQVQNALRFQMQQQQQQMQLGQGNIQQMQGPNGNMGS